MAVRQRTRNPISRLFRVLWRKARTLKRLVFPPTYDPFTAESAGGAKVAYFFADTPFRIYQIAQWLPVIEKSPADLNAVIITRSMATTEELRKLTNVPIIYARTFDLLMSLLELSKFKAIIYVNNSYQNFQTLSYQEAVHIHVNHGESDKISMVSNQAKAYDRVFVAGPAAKDRYLRAVAWIDQNKLITVGRPQLDLGQTPIRAHPKLKTITYAPTWEGEDEANNYTSMDLFGKKIIDAALNQSNSRTIYKPHPRILSSKDPEVVAAHKYIISRLSKAPHQVLLEGDVIEVLLGTDLLISDISSVTLDYLYLKPGGAIFLSDRRTNLASLESESPVAFAATIIDGNSVDKISIQLEKTLQKDDLAAKRAEVCRYYFGGIAAGESSKTYFAAILKSISEHEVAVSELTRTRRSI
jgi:CDP-glycerol glycerophosphotransferase (TagB/SpsB family)